MRIFNLNIKKLMWMLTPTFLRTESILHILYRVGSALEVVQTAFNKNRETNLYYLSISSQVCRLEKLLNDRFDNEKRRIYIDTFQRKKHKFIYLISENKPVFLNPSTFVYTDLELQQHNTQNTHTFTIIVPAVLQFDANEMTALVNAEKLVGKTFNIKTI